ncbi:hypothetical protein Vi05172_g11167 [Venturia inaequalis]|nr:hypothetical protein Vi05172_g11167 [Venturia inaequalis]
MWYISSPPDVRVPGLLLNSDRNDKTEVTLIISSTLIYRSSPFARSNDPILSPGAFAVAGAAIAVNDIEASGSISSRTLRFSNAQANLPVPTLVL